MAEPSDQEARTEAPALPPAAQSRRSRHTRQYVLPPSTPPPTHVLLYYAYRRVAEPAASADEHAALCARLQLSGRVLVAEEGINGTVAGTEAAVEAYIVALCSHPVLRLRPADFKHSPAAGAACPFSRELFVLVVPEIVESGGALLSVPPEETGEGYLTPEEWRAALLAARDAPGGDTVTVDVRNAREVALGRFDGSLDPDTSSFAEFPTWVSAHEEALRGKRVLLYCTGGVRCEKASAWLRGLGLASEVRHLRGGIHKYLEAFGEDGLWRGKNYVFDRRAANDNDTPSLFPVGACIACGRAWEHMDGLTACTVCNEPVLACDACAAEGAERHCPAHAHLRSCFFRRLHRFSAEQLLEQLRELDALAAAEAGRGRRRTLAAQAARVRAALAAPHSEPQVAEAEVEVEERVLWVSGQFPTDAAHARAAWPCRSWPLSARPWAWIRDAAPPANESASLCVEVDCKIAVDGSGPGPRLAPAGCAARTRVRPVGWDPGRGSGGASALAVALTLRAEGELAEVQAALHLRWLGFELCADERGAGEGRGETDL